MVSMSIIHLQFQAVDARQLFSHSLCFVAKRYILQQKCPKKWIGSAILGTRLYNFQPPEHHNAQCHRQADRLTVDSMMPIADPTVYQYDW